MGNKSDLNEPFWGVSLLKSFSGIDIPTELSKNNTAWYCNFCVSPEFIWYIFLPYNRSIYGWNGMGWTFVKSLSTRKVDPLKIIGGVFRQ
jgi:hypothetical protein